MNYTIRSTYSDTLAIYYFRGLYKTISKDQKDFIENNWGAQIQECVKKHSTYKKYEKYILEFMEYYTMRLKLTRPPEYLL